MARARQSPGIVEFPGVRFIVLPEPQTIRHDIVKLSRLIHDYEQPLRWSKQTIIDDVKNAFETETDPVTGIPWPALSTTAEKVPRYGKLQRRRTNRRLYRAMIQPQNYGITKGVSGGVFINQRRIPMYAAYHQQDDLGKLREPRNEEIHAERMRLLHARTFHKIAKNNQELAMMIKTHALENVKENIKAEAESKGKIGRIPRRRFLGPSDYAQDLMRKNFDRWAKDTIVIYKRSGRLVVSRRAGTL